MPKDRLLLLTDSRCLRELVDHGGLPEGLVVTPNGRTPDLSDSRLAGKLVACDPDLFVSGEVRNRTEDQQRDVFYGQLIGTSMCHLVVLDAVAQLHDGTSDAARPNTTRALQDWYERFMREANRIPKRRQEFRHVLIVVCADGLPAERERDIDALLENAREFVDECYVMADMLELGQNQVIHASYGWPLPTARLLFRLLSEVQKQRAGGSVSRYAWRALEIAPGLDPERIQEQCDHHVREQASRLLSRAVGGEDLSTWNATYRRSFAPESDSAQLPPLKLAPIEAPMWAADDAREALSLASDAARGDAAMAEAGRSDRATFAAGAEARLRAIQDSVRYAWSLVAGGPGCVGMLLNQGRPEPQDLHAHLDRVTAQWRAIRELDQEHQERLAIASACVDEYEKARAAFIGFNVRVLIGIVVAIAAAFLGHSILRGLWDSAWVTLGVVVAAAAGASIAAYWTARQEQRAGEVAAKSMGELLGAADDAVRERGEAARTAARLANEFWTRLRARAAAARLERLLRRVQLVLVRELTPESEGVEHRSGWSKEAAMESPDTAEFQADQRARLRRLTTISAQGSLAGPARRIDLVEVIARFEHELLHFWRDVCERHDKLPAGHLPATVLSERIREFARQFREAVSGEVRRQLLTPEAGVESPSVLSSLAEALNDRFSYFMSYPMAGPPSAADAVHTVVFLNPDHAHPSPDRNHPFITKDGEFLRGTGVVAIAIQTVRLEQIERAPAAESAIA